MLIGLAGAKHSGKNTCAEFIREYFGGDFDVREWSFAEDLKKSAAASLGIYENGVDFCNELKECGDIHVYFNNNVHFVITGREFLQLYGTEAHRDVFGQSFWVENLLTKIQNNEDGGFGYHGGDYPHFDLITDVRFPNEAQAIKSMGGKIIQIVRESEADGDAHASEKPLDRELVDRVIGNNSTLGALKETIIFAVEEECKDYISDSLKREGKLVPYA